MCDQSHKAPRLSHIEDEVEDCGLEARQDDQREDDIVEPTHRPKRRDRFLHTLEQSTRLDRVVADGSREIEMQKALGTIDQAAQDIRAVDDEALRYREQIDKENRLLLTRQRSVLAEHDKLFQQFHEGLDEIKKFEEHRSTANEGTFVPKVKKAFLERMESDVLSRAEMLLKSKENQFDRAEANIRELTGNLRDAHSSLSKVQVQAECDRRAATEANNELQRVQQENDMLKQNVIDLTQQNKKTHEQMLEKVEEVQRLVQHTAEKDIVLQTAQLRLDQLMTDSDIARDDYNQAMSEIHSLRGEIYNMNGSFDLVRSQADDDDLQLRGDIDHLVKALSETSDQVNRYRQGLIEYFVRWTIARRAWRIAEQDLQVSRNELKVSKCDQSTLKDILDSMRSVHKERVRDFNTREEQSKRDINNLSSMHESVLAEKRRQDQLITDKQNEYENKVKKLESQQEKASIKWRAELNSATLLTNKQKIEVHALKAKVEESDARIENMRQDLATLSGGGPPTDADFARHSVACDTSSISLDSCTDRRNSMFARAGLSMYPEVSWSEIVSIAFRLLLLADAGSVDHTMMLQLWGKVEAIFNGNFEADAIKSPALALLSAVIHRVQAADVGVEHSSFAIVTAFLERLQNSTSVLTDCASDTRLEVVCEIVKTKEEAKLLILSFGKQALILIMISDGIIAPWLVGLEELCLFSRGFRLFVALDIGEQIILQVLKSSGSAARAWFTQQNRFHTGKFEVDGVAMDFWTPA